MRLLKVSERDPAPCLRPQLSDSLARRVPKFASVTYPHALKDPKKGAPEKSLVSPI